MGLLSILFKKKYASKEEFPVLCFNLSRMLDSIRKNWIEGCKIILEAQTGKSLDDIITNEGPIDSLSKALQLLASSKFVATHTYVNPSETKSFSDLLYAEVFGDDLLQCLEYVKIYEKYQQSSQANYQYAKDMAQCFLGTAVSEEEISCVQSTMEIFTTITQMATADVFSDYKTVKKKEIAVINLIKKQEGKPSVNYELLKDLT